MLQALIRFRFLGIVCGFFLLTTCCFLSAGKSVLSEEGKAKEDPPKAKEDRAVQAEPMNNRRLAALLKKRFKNIGGREGFWLIKIPEKEEQKDAEEEPAILMVVTDERADRMRIMMPIKEFDAQKDKDLAVKLLEANFDRALDAKYAINGKVLWSTFVHPLSNLSEAELTNALDQVQTLRKNTGTTYSSSDLFFGGGVPNEEKKKPDA